MIKTIQVISFFAIALFLGSCESDSSSSMKEGLDNSRPHSPWAFRSVLDLQPRILTLALTDDIWVSYRVDNGSMYKAWKGGVDFDGPVYTTHHGPQPISIGDAYMLSEDKSPFSISKGGELLKADVKYLGHSTLNDKAVLNYELRTSGLETPILVSEQVDASSAKEGNPILNKVFTTQGVPDNVKVVYQEVVSSIILPQSIKTDGEMKVLQEETYQWRSKEMFKVSHQLSLNSNAETSYDIRFASTPTINNPNKGKNSQEKENTGLPEGAKLIAKNDCKTCHNKKVKTIGPAYVSVAERYKTTDENISYLVNKVKMGGSGKWGDQVMNAHPDLSEAKITKMVEYILSLDAGMPSETENKASTEGLGEQINAAEVEEENLIPGMATYIYRIPENTRLVPNQNSLGKPLFGGVMPSFANVEGEKFVKLENDFAIYAEGLLKVANTEEVSFRMWSDDGSKLYIGDKEIIDNDGPHGTEYVEASVQLEAGYHPVRIEFYQGGGGKFLSFNWKTKGMEKWATVPEDALYHQAGQYDFTDLTLPMATVTMIPGDRRALEEVHPSFDLSQARPDSFTPKVGGIDFLSDGRMVVSTWDAAGSVYTVTNPSSGDPSSMVVTKIAEGLAEPLGLKVVDDEIYIMQKQELTKLVDSDQDGLIDTYQTISDKWRVSANFHEFGFGLAYKDGYFYAALATAIEPGGASTQPQIPDRGKCVKINKETGETSFIASGLRTPNGVGIGYNDEIYIADNQGDWLPSCKILHVTEGAWFGSRSVDPVASKNWEEKQPVVWLPQDEIGNSPSTPLAINLGPYQNQMIHGEVTHGGVKRVFVEEVEGQYQGAVFRFIQGLEAGVNRLAWGPDGALYAGGIGAPGNWGQSGKLWYGLQRLAYNGKSTFEMLAVRAMSDGIEIEFTEPLQEGDAWSPEDYEIVQWYYQPTEEYGGPKLDERDLKITNVSVSEDRKKVSLQLAGMKENHVIYVRLKNHFVSDKGNSLWTTEAWYTLNKLPANKKVSQRKLSYTIQDNSLTPSEKEAGWELLFDGKSMDQWHNFNATGIGKSWVIDDNAIHLNAVQKEEGGWQAADGGDLISEKEYEDFELKLEWKIGNCGNSGVMYNVVESDKYEYPWKTGPEMQILDNTCHPDTRYRKHKAGDLYDLKESAFITVNPAGEWNKARIVSKDGSYSFWLNGYETVSFTMHDESWEALINESKFKGWEGFGEARKGHLSLQDHGDPVWFKNIKIRPL